VQPFQDVFISYGRRDSLEFAAKLNRHLVDRGLNVWFDFDDIPVGVDYQKQIDDGIERSDNFVFVISPHAVNSPYCLKEIELALKRHKRIIPLIHVERVSRETWQERYPTGTDADWQEYQAQGLHDHFQNMHPAIRKINWVYFREGIDDFEASFAKLLGIFDQHKAYVNQHTMLLIKALEWERQQRRSQFLLVGEGRLQAGAWLKTRFKDSQPPCLPTDLHCELITESLKNADNLMTQVFLAYADEQRATAQMIRQSLMREGFTVWLSSNDIRTGVDFQTAINRGIEEADNLVYLMSPAFVQSEYCQQEIAHALSLHKRLVPILAEPVSPEQMPVALRQLHYIDLTDNVLETDYQQDESQLIRVLRENAAYHEAHKVLLAKALKWQRQHQNPTFLLRGYNLRHTEAWLKVAHQTPAYPPTALQEAFIAASLQQPPGGSLDVFISYSRVDSGIARQLSDRLQIQGKRTWFDQESIAAGTADFQAEIHRGIESADHFLFILSPNSVNSSYCADEVEYAAKLNKRFVTILHRPIDTATLHPELAKVQWLDFSQPDRDDSANFQALLRILETDAEHLQVHTRLLVRAIEWEGKARSHDLLMRGAELEAIIQWLDQSAEKEPKATQLQRDYIHDSRRAEVAQQEIEIQRQQIEIERQKKARKQITLALIVAMGGFVIAVGLGLVAFKQYKEAEFIQESQINSLSNYSVALRNLGQNWQALLEGLKAVQPPTFGRTSLYTQIRVSVALQQALANVMERNQLEGHTDRVTSIVFSPDGKVIASSSDDQTIKLWALEGKEIRTLKGHNGFVLDISFSPDGQTIASASSDGTVKLWTLDGKEIRTFRGHKKSIWAVSFSPDGKLLGTASADKTAKLWSLDGKVLQTLQHSDRVNSISFSRNNQTVVTASQDATAQLWTISGKKLSTLSGHRSGVNTARFSPDGKTIATASEDKTVKLWNAEGQELNLSSPIQAVASIKSASFSPDGKIIITASEDKTVGLWSLKGQSLETLKGHTQAVIAAVFSPDSHFIASAGADKTVRLWQAQKRGLTAFKRHSDSVTSVSFSPDGKTIATASGDKTVKLWNLGGQELKTLKGHTEGINSVSFSPDGKTIATASGDQTVKLWNLSGQELKTLKGHTEIVHSVSFSPDGKTIATASADQTAKLWSSDGKVLRTLTGHRGTVYSVGFSPNGKTVITGGKDGTIRLWDLNGQALKIIQAHQEPVFSISVSPDGRLLASASRDTTVKLWTLEGQELETLRGHTEPVMSVSFSPDAKLIATASTDKQIKLWNLEGQELSTLEGHSDAVDVVRFSPDSHQRVLLSGSNDKTAILWNLDLASLQILSCDRISQYLATHATANEDFKTCRTPLTSDGEGLLAFSRGQELALQGKVTNAIAAFQEALRLHFNQLDFAPNMLAQQLAASYWVDQGLRLLQLGDAKQAMAAYAQAQKVDPTLEISAQAWNDLCWEGSLNQQARVVLAACDRAVALEPTNSLWRDTRGLARAKLGGYLGARQDFQAFIDWTKSAEATSTRDPAELERARNRRQQWIETLKKGKDPFSPEAIKFLMDEKI
jgi:WD40 repeat protein